VVLLDVWTFGCINCVRTIPWVREMAERYGSRGLSVIGIHTPEFSFERGREAVGAEVRKHGLDFPHLIDDDRSYWNALGVYAWPSLFLVDRCGTLRARAVGEVHSGEESGRRFEAELRALLAEAPGACGR
jgi:thiol-disulfide isomerase/thioredoxin